MAKKCYGCGYLNRDEVFFCDGCGEPLFESNLGVKEESPYSLPPTAPANLQTLPPALPTAIPAQQQDYGPPVRPTPPYPGQVGYPPLGHQQPRRKGFKDWSGGAMFAFVSLVILGIAIILITAGYMFWFANHPHPKLDAEPPAGWYLASEAELEAYEDNYNSRFDDVDMDYLYFSDTKGETIVVLHQQKYSLFAEPPPDTDDLSEMETWLYANEASLRSKMLSGTAEKGVSITIENVYARKFTKDGVAIQVDTVFKDETGTFQVTVLCFNKHSTAYVVTIQTLGRTRDKEVIDFIVENMSFE